MYIVVYYTIVESSDSFRKPKTSQKNPIRRLGGQEEKIRNEARKRRKDKR